MAYIIVNEHGQIIGEMGIFWRWNDGGGLYSTDPRGYFIELSDDEMNWKLFRKTLSSYPEKVPYVQQVLTTGSISQCMRVAEIYQVQRIR